MRHLIFLFLIALCTLLGASCKNSKSERISRENKIYQNEFFSLEFPFNWEYDEEINDMCDSKNLLYLLGIDVETIILTIG